MLRILTALTVLAVLAAVAAGRAGAAPPDPAVRARAVLAERAAGLRLPPDLSDLVVAEVRSGLGGEYVRFNQTVGGVPVLGAGVVVGLPAGGGEAQVSSAYRPALDHRRGPVRASPAAALAAVYGAVGASPAALRGEAEVAPAYFQSAGELVPGWTAVLPLGEPLGTWFAGIDGTTGEVLFVSNVLRFDEGRVFDPNPPRDSGGAIPPPTECDTAANEPALSTQYVLRPLQGIASGQDRLKGEYADLTAPGISGAYKPAGQAIEPSRSYVYPCTDDRFEEVMTYYHIDATQRAIQSLGFSGAAAILDRPVPAHAHFFSSCNAFYDPANRGIHLGDSTTCGLNADTGEDADVIVHEYGHAVQDAQVPAWGFGATADAEEAWALGEGFADFLPAARFGDPCLAEWFSFGGPCLRTLDNTSVYPADYDACRPSPSEAAEPHCAGLIWGGALWDLVEAFGGGQDARDLVLTLVLESHFLLHPLAKMHEAAAAVRQADAMVYGGAHAAVIDSVFAARGLSTGSAIDEFEYAYLRIEHGRRGQLDVDLLVGSTSAPVCSLALYGPDPGDTSSGLVGYATLTGSACAGFLPPSAGQPWYLRVADTIPGYSGTLREFEIALAGSLRCVAADVPVGVPDNGPPVYSAVDCTNTATGDLADDDGDGFNNAAERHIGTDPAQPCGADGWPAELATTAFSAGRLDIIDLASFIAPVQRYGTSPGDGGFDVRWDVQPGRGLLGEVINIQDLMVLALLDPPMFGGARAYNGPSCQ